MKKCPKCKAEIQESARFCLYCMTSFEEKQAVDVNKNKGKGWLIIAVALLALLLIGAVIAFGLNCGDGPSKNPSVPIGGSSLFDNSDDTGSSEDSSSQDNSSSDVSGSTALGSSSESKDSSSGKESSSDKSSSSGGSKPSSSKNESNSPSSDTSSSDKPSSGGSSSNSSSENSSSGGSSGTSSSGGSSSVSSTTPRFSYEIATIYNAYPSVAEAMYAPENAIVITKVLYTAADGKYIIPETYEGKKVAAIMPSAFSDVASSVRSVTLPATVRTIWSDAFKGCNNLTDLYLKSSVIGIFEDAFVAPEDRNGRLTIHCKRDCRNFNYYYYRNIAGTFDADYKEWNG